MNYFNNFSDFLEKNKTNVFSLRALKKNFTPYEQDQKFTDESCYELVFENCVIDTVVNLSNDYLIGFRNTYIDSDIVDNEYTYNIIISEDILYFKLSDILLRDVTLDWLNQLEECGLRE